jgi:UDP-3-O-[3-hydroxymyristoyl] glucosamine N-acyltransferase
MVVNATVRQLADLVRGTVVGDADLVVLGARPLQEAGAGDITFLEDPRREPLLRQCCAIAAIVPANFALDGKTLIQVADPLTAFVAVFLHFQGKEDRPQPGIDARAVVHPAAQIGEGTSIMPLASVGANCVVGQRCVVHGGVVISPHCTLGDDVVLYPNAVLYTRTVVGDRSIIHAGAVIGADGFGYRFVKGRHVKVPQLGNVVIEADVEIGAGTTIDRGTFGTTRIGAGTKIDNLVQIAHNCQIGQHNILAGQVGIAGSCKTGAYVVLAGQVGIKDHVKIGDGATIGAQSGIQHDVAPRTRMMGSPALEDRDAARVIATLKRLPEMRKDLARVLRHLGLSEPDEKAKAA